MMSKLNLYSFQFLLFISSDVSINAESKKKKKEKKKYYYKLTFFLLHRNNTR
jgi:hypothetical protein